MRKLTSALLAFIMAIMLIPVSVLAAGTVLTVSAPDALPAKGETFSVTVSISGNPGLCAVQYTLSFDKSVVTCQSVALGKVLSGMLSATNPDAANGAIVAAAGTNAKTGNGVLSEYTFKVLKSGDPGFALCDGVFTGGDNERITTNVPAPVVKQESKPIGDPKQPTTQETPVPPTTPAAQGTEPTGEAAGETAAPVSTFADVPASYWGSAYIEKAVALGLINGMGDGTFAPEKNMTRAQFVSMLYRLSGDAAVTTDAQFTDVGADSWFRDAVNWAAEKGYATGDGKTFRPDGNITRQEVVTILYRYNGGVSGMETMLGAFGVDNLAGYTDRAEIASWALDAMRWAIFRELVNGTTDTTVSPTGTAKRAQVAAIFVRYADK